MILIKLQLQLKKANTQAPDTARARTKKEIKENKPYLYECTRKKVHIYNKIKDCI